MYKEFYGLTAYPFALTSDPEFFYPSAAHEGCLRHLLHGLERDYGLLVLTGEVGVGKTILVHALVRILDKHTHIAFLVHSRLDPLDILQSVSQEFGLDTVGKSKTELLSNLRHLLLSYAMVNEPALLIIDEAQNLSIDVLEELRLLRNFEHKGRALLPMILIGQTPLEDTLERPELMQLRQRIEFQDRLRALDEAETQRYVERRLAIAGARYLIFTPSAMQEIFIHTRGVPRLINLLCDRALFSGWSAQTHEVGHRMIQRAAKELHLGATPPLLRSLLMRPRRVTLAVGLFAVGLVVGGMLVRNVRQWSRLGEHTSSSVPAATATVPSRSGAVGPPLLPQRLAVREEPLLPPNPEVYPEARKLEWQQTLLFYQLPTGKPFTVPLPPFQQTPADLPVTVVMEAPDGVPAWLTFDPEKLTLSGTAPSTAANTTYRLMFRASFVGGRPSLLNLTFTLMAGE